MALCTLIKAIVMEPDATYRSQDAHRCTRQYSNAQVQLVLSSLRGDRLIRQRKANKDVDSRGWALTGLATEILYGRREDKDSQQLIRAWKSTWASADLLSVVELSAVLKKAQAETVVDSVGRGDFRVLTALLEEEDVQGERKEGQEEAKEVANDQAREEAREESKMAVDDERAEEEKAPQDGEELREEEEKKSGPVERGKKLEQFVQAADQRAAVADLTGSTVQLLSTRWPLIARAGGDAATSPLQPPAATQPLPMEDESPARLPILSWRVPVDDAPVEDASGGDSLLVQLLPADPPFNGAAVEAGADDEAHKGISATSDLVVRVLTEAGPAGLSMPELAAKLKDDSSVDSALLEAAVRRATRYVNAVRVFSYDHERYVAREFADRWAFAVRRDVEGAAGEVSAVVAHPWRLMGGDVNREVWEQLYDAVLGTVREWPGVKEERLLAMFPVLTPREMRHVVDTLLLDDAVCRRTWSQEKDKGAEEEEEMQESGMMEKEDLFVTCYFPIVRSSC